MQVILRALFDPINSHGRDVKASSYQAAANPFAEVVQDLEPHNIQPPNVTSPQRPSGRLLPSTGHEPFSLLPIPLFHTHHCGPSPILKSHGEYGEAIQFHHGQKQPFGDDGRSSETGRTVLDRVGKPKPTACWQLSIRLVTESYGLISAPQSDPKGSLPISNMHV